MARVPYVDQDDLPPEYRDELVLTSNVSRALANSPSACRASGGMARYIRHENGLDPRLREMAIIQVGYLTGAAYEYTHHIAYGFEFGVTEDDVRAIADETAGRETALATLDKAVLRGAREMTAGLAMSAETFAELQAGLGNEHLIELILAVGNYNGVVRMLATLEVDLEDDYQDYLKRFPLAAG